MRHCVSSPDETLRRSSKILRCASRRIFNSLLSVSSVDETLRLMLDIYIRLIAKIVNLPDIYRGYYTVARRYEFYFRVTKQNFTNERSE